MIWFQIVERTSNVSVAEAKQNIGATEFIKWKARFEKEWTERSRLDYWLAEISFRLYLLWYIQLDPKDRPEFEEKEKHFLKFKLVGAKEPGPTEEELRKRKEEYERELQYQKAFWGAIAMGGQDRPLPEKVLQRTKEYMKGR